jgi:aminotransferase
VIDYNTLLTPTVVQMKPSGIRKFFDIANTMEGVISLGVGEPDFRTPWQVRSAGIRSLQRASTRYTSNLGLMELRSEIANYVKRKYNVDYVAEREVLVTVGGSEAIDVTIRALTNPGDEIIIPQPSYVCYEPMTRLAGGVPVIINTQARNAFKLTAEELRAAITPRTKALILPYPCNPTGAIMERADLEAIAEVLRDTNIIVISDEIYAELTFGEERHVSIASIDGMQERCVLINGFSKAFSMTGWRLGYACGPAPLLSQIMKIHQYAIMCAPTTSQYAAVEALRSCDEEVEKMREEYDARRRLIVKGFNDIGL